MTIGTRFTDLVGCEVPIQQAGMGAASTPELAAAVSNAGGLGMLTATADDVPADVDAALAATAGRPFGVNFLMPFFDRAVLDAVAPRVRLVERFWGQPDPVLVRVAHDAGALAAWQVGSRDEAVAAADAGCDLIVAQGVEAGGHVRGTIGLLPLLDIVLGAVEVPVVAAGGIGTGRGVAAVLAAGAVCGADRDPVRGDAGIWSSPRLQAGPGLRPGGRHRAHGNVRHLVARRAAPGAALRGASRPSTRRRAGRRRQRRGRAVLPIPRFAVRPPNRATRGHIDAMALYAGQSVAAVTAITRSRRRARDRNRRRAALVPPLGPALITGRPAARTREPPGGSSEQHHPKELQQPRGSPSLRARHRQNGPTLNLDGGPIGRGTFEPGWQWSKHVKPIVGTASCQTAHMGYVVSGRMKIVMDDGEDAEFSPGDIMGDPARPRRSSRR